MTTKKNTAAKKRPAKKAPATVATLTIAAGGKTHSAPLTKADVDTILGAIPRDNACATGKKFLAALEACGLLPPRKYDVAAVVEATSFEEAKRIVKERFGDAAMVANPSAGHITYGNAGQLLYYTGGA